MATFHTFHCVYKERDKNNVITLYTLKDLSNNKFCDIEPDRLKKLLRNKSIYVDNLKLTSDNKIIDNNKESDNLLNKYIESCKILGVKPLNIKYEQGKYIVVDIPKDTSIIIPQFVDAVCMKKELSRHIDSKYIPNKSDIDTDGMVTVLKGLSSKTDKVIKELEDLEDKTDDIIQNQQRNSTKSSEELANIQKELNELTDKIEDMPSELSVITDYINGLNKDEIENNRRYALALNKLQDTVLDLSNEILFSPNRILDKNSIPDNSKMLKDKGNIAINKYTYTSQKCPSNIGKYIPFEKLDSITPYINYAANMYTNLYERMLIQFDIKDNCRPEFMEKSVSHVLGFCNYILTGCLIGCIISNPVGLEIGTAFAAAYATGEIGKNFISELGTLTIEHSSFAKNKQQRKNIRKITKSISESFPELEEVYRSINNYLDKEIFVFALESIMLHCDDSILHIDKDAVYNKVMLRTLYRLLKLDSINFEEIALPVKASYLASCMYVNENCKFKNDFDLNEVYYTISKHSTLKLSKNTNRRNKLSPKEKCIFDRQTYYYAFVVKYFEVCLYKCNIAQAVVDKILDIFHEEASDLGLTPADITVEQFNRPQDIDIERLCIN